MKNTITAIITVVAIILIATLGYAFVNRTLPNQEVACTLEAKICPDGSTVGRTGPNCEFAMCPVVSEEGASTTKQFFDATLGVGFDYIDNFYVNNNLTQYVHPVEWPPQLSVSTSTYACKTTGNIVSADGKTETRTINGKIYCLTTQSEGAAGSVYTTYTYKIPVQKKTVSLSFITRTPQCTNYDDPKRAECEKEKLDFNIDQMVDKIFTTIKFQ